MSKKLSISLPNYFFETYIPRTKNRSEYIQRLITMGATAAASNPMVIESHAMVMRDRIAAQDKELGELKSLVARLKAFNSEVKKAEREAVRASRESDRVKRMRERKGLREFRI
jgi:hypothetical protein